MQHPEAVTIESRDLALALAQLAHDKQAEDIVVLDVSRSLGITDYFVIASGRNPRHLQALARELQQTMKQQGRLRLHASGIGPDSRWVLLDFDEVVVHLFLPEARTFYGLENLWADATKVEFSPETSGLLSANSTDEPPPLTPTQSP